MIMHQLIEIMQGQVSYSKGVLKRCSYVKSDANLIRFGRYDSLCLQSLKLKHVGCTQTRLTKRRIVSRGRV